MQRFEPGKALLVAILALSGAVAHAERYVNAFTGADAGTCTNAAAPCKTITYAVGQANALPGDIVNVAPGTYNATLGEVFPILVGQGLQLRSTAGAEATIISASGTVKRVMQVNSSSVAVTVQGFTLQDGINVSLNGTFVSGGAMTIAGNAVIRKNIFLNNQALGFNGISGLPVGGDALGGAIYVSSGSPYIVNNVFRNNSARGGNGFGDGVAAGSSGGTARGGALYVNAGNATIYNNTFYGNSATGGTGATGGPTSGNGGSGQFGAVYSGDATFSNNILASNAANAGSGGLGFSPGVSGSATAGGRGGSALPQSYNNLFHANKVNGAPSTGDVTGINPICYFGGGCASVNFHSEPTELRILISSPAAFAGILVDQAADDFDSVPRPNPPSIGAFEPGLYHTTVGIISSANPSAAGAAVTFTATVSAVVGGTPTGTLTFKNGTTPICNPVTLSGGGAQCTVTFPMSSSHSITGQYNGSGTHAPGVSAPLIQVVQGVTGPPRLGNLSTRMQVLTGNEVMIAGFIIGGSVPKTVVVNAAGPSLANFGISTPLQNPALSLVRGSDSVIIATNDDWQNQAAGNVAAIQNTGLQPNNALEPAIFANLAPGAYTAIVSGSDGGNGVGLVGIFEVDQPGSPFVNISTRGKVLIGNDVMIAGFIVQGTGPQKVVINVAGPSLANFGIANRLGDPTLTLVRGSDNAVIGVNDNWQAQTNPADVAAIQATGFQPNNALEPALIATLQPGAYTAIVSGVNQTTGVAVVGVFTTP